MDNKNEESKKNLKNKVEALSSFQNSLFLLGSFAGFMGCMFIYLMSSMQSSVTQWGISISLIAASLIILGFCLKVHVLKMKFSKELISTKNLGKQTPTEINKQDNLNDFDFASKLKQGCVALLTLGDNLKDNDQLWTLTEISEALIIVTKVDLNVEQKYSVAHLLDELENLSCVVANLKILDSLEKSDKTISKILNFLKEAISNLMEDKREEFVGELERQIAFISSRAQYSSEELNLTGFDFSNKTYRKMVNNND